MKTKEWPEPWWNGMEVKCPGCDAEYELKGEDAQRAMEFGSTQRMATFVCNRCGAFLSAISKKP